MEMNCIHFDCLSSTNTWSKDNYQIFDLRKLTLVTAKQQTSGYGRFKRQWISCADQNLHATFTFFLEKELKDLGNLTQVAALSVHKTLKELGFHSQLKWPNDIQINKKKISGILCETIIDDHRLVVVLGIGININMPFETLLQINQPATSLWAESNQEFSVQEVMEKLQNHFSKDLSLFLQQGFNPFLEEYRKHILHKEGDVLTINEKKGTFHIIDSDGQLVMVLPNGQKQKFHSGEIAG